MNDPRGLDPPVVLPEEEPFRTCQNCGHVFKSDSESTAIGRIRVVYCPDCYSIAVRTGPNY